MSLSVIHTRAALGVKAPLVTVEVHISAARHCRSAYQRRAARPDIGWTARNDGKGSQRSCAQCAYQ